MTTSMRPSRVLRKLRAGEPTFCFKINTGDPRVGEIASLSGIDCVWLDREHCPNDLRAIEDQVRACLLHGADAMVRVPRGSYSELIWPLEMNATGIMVPHIANARGCEAGRADDPLPSHRPATDGRRKRGRPVMCGLSTTEYCKQANAERFVIAQIEDPEPLEELDAITATLGIDMILFGPGDFSHAIGFPGELDHPAVVDARRRVLEACKRHGKFAGTVGSPTQAIEYVKSGFNFVNVGADVVALMQYFGQIIGTLKKSAAGSASGPY